MSKRILYVSQENELAVIIPADCGIPVEEIARKDVPSGVSYWIVNEEDLPTDLFYRDAWEIDINLIGSPDGIGIGAEAWFSEQAYKESINDKN